MNEKGDLRELYQSGVARTPENDPERGDYVPIRGLVVISSSIGGVENAA
jgi:hypothetical protein